MPVTRRPRRSAAQWQRLIQQQAASGLTASVYCDRYDLSYASFLQWRRRLQATEPACDMGPDPAVGRPLTVQSMPFIELTAPDAPTTVSDGAEHWLIELDLGSGVRLRIAQPR
jgi:hypothetical protein